jgi:hypothetical protein
MTANLMVSSSQYLMALGLMRPLEDGHNAWHFVPVQRQAIEGA